MRLLSIQHCAAWSKAMQNEKIANQFGFFDETTGEYVITRRIHPRPGSITWAKEAMVGSSRTPPEATPSIAIPKTGV